MAPLFRKAEEAPADEEQNVVDVLLFRSVDITVNRGTTNAVTLRRSEYGKEEVQEFHSDSGDPTIGRVTLVLKRELRGVPTDKDGKPVLPEDETYDWREL